MDPLQLTVTLTPTGQGYSLNVACNHPLDANAIVKLLADAIKAVASSQEKAPASVIEVAHRMPTVANGVR